MDGNWNEQMFPQFLVISVTRDNPSLYNLSEVDTS